MIAGWGLKMARKPNLVSEAEISVAVLRIAATQPSGVATFHRLRRETPNYVRLSAADRTQSVKRPNEEMWEQRFRNIKSHYAVPGNILFEGYAEHVPRVGYRITPAGRRHLQHLGY